MSMDGRTSRTSSCYRVTVGDSSSHLLSRDPSPPDVRTITLLHGDDGEEQLFVDHHLVDPSRWHWNFDGTMLRWDDRIGTTPLSGQLAFAPDLRRAAGSVRVGASAGPVGLAVLQPGYIVDVSADAGATATPEAAGMTLTWDASKFDAATWSTALKWNYAVRTHQEPLGDESYTTVHFRDEQTHVEWKPSALPLDSVFTVMLDVDRKLVFQLQGGIDPPTDDRSKLTGDDAKVSSVFPYEMVFQFDQLAESFDGAMLVGHPDASGTVYAIRGNADNQSIVGEYTGGGARFAVHGGQLVVGGKPVAGSSVTGNRLTWSGLEPGFAATTGLPAEGELEFSHDGASVTGGVATGARRVSEPSERAPVPGAVLEADAEPALQPETLLGMDPHGKDANGQVVDLVQAAAMEDFYKVIQYYMDPTLRSTFISTNAPDLGPDLQPIAQDGPKNQAWYAAFGVPYLASALAGSTDPALKQLNVARARQMLKTGAAKAPVYTEQSQRMYALEWVAKFPETTSFLTDQVQNAAIHNPAINADITAWKAELAKEATSDPKTVAQMQQLVESLRAPALAQKYWAYVLFRHLTSTEYLGLLRLQLSNGNTSQPVALDLKRYCAILDLLDPTNFFSAKFLQVVQLYTVTGVLANLLDFSGPGVEEHYRYAITEILKAFVAAYADGQDPQMKSAALEVQKLLESKIAEQGIAPYLDALFEAAVATSSTAGWDIFAKRYQSIVVNKLGSGAVFMARLMGAASLGMGIYMLWAGHVKWRDFTKDDLAQVVTGASGVLADLVTLMVKKGLQCEQLVEAGFAPSQAAKWFFRLGPDLDAVAESGFWLRSGFTNWLSRGAANAAGLPYRTASEFASDNPVTAGIFGRSLDEFMATRFAAVMAVVGIVLSAIALAQTGQTPLETAMNSLFVAAASLDLISAVAGWVGSVVAAESAGALACSWIGACAGPLGLAMVIAGVIIMVIIAETAPPPQTPIGAFVNGPAKDAGYFMEFGGEIDSFSLSADGAGNLLTGISLQTGSSLYLNTTADGTAGAGALSHAWDSVFGLSCDECGHALIEATVPGGGGALYLTAKDGGGVAFIPAATDADGQGRQQWTATAQSITKDNDGHVTAGNFALATTPPAGTAPQYLVVNNGALVLGASPQIWAVAITGLHPDGLSYMGGVALAAGPQTVPLSFPPTLLAPGSEGRTWRAVQPLPAFLTLDTTTGTVSTVAGSTATAMPVTTYEIEVSNAYGSTSGQLSVTVAVPQTAPVAVPQPAAATLPA